MKNEIQTLVRKGTTYEFFEELDEEGYFYSIAIEWDGKEGDVIVTNFGVSIDWPDGSSIHTNLSPNLLFPDSTKSLTKSQLIHLLDILSATSLEGKSYSTEEMSELYQKWQRETE